MPEIQINSDDCLAIALRNGIIGIFSLRDVSIWQCIRIDDQQINDLHRYLMKFTPNGQIFVCNGQSKQLYIYMKLNMITNKIWWQFQRKIVSKNLPLSIDLNNETLFIADIDGDIYRIDLTLNNSNDDLILSNEYCIMKTKSISLEILFIEINETNSMFITVDQNNQICLNHYPNTSDIVGYCRGHNEFISHIKLIDNNHIISASADGTIRIWRVPACIPVVLLNVKAFLLFSKEVFFSDLNMPRNNLLFENSEDQILTSEILLKTSSMINYSIWKMDVMNNNVDIIIVFSIYAERFHSIYLTDIDNMKQLTNQQRKLIFNSHYGIIVDYCFINSISNSYLYVLFDRNIIVRVDVRLIVNYKNREFLHSSDEVMNEINSILTREEFHLKIYQDNLILFNEIIFIQGLKNHNHSINKNFLKRKDESIENEQRKKPIVIDSEDNMTGEECS